jgi:hypothetical protein
MFVLLFLFMLVKSHWIPTYPQVPVAVSEEVIRSPEERWHVSS